VPRGWSWAKFGHVGLGLFCIKFASSSNIEKACLIYFRNCMPSLVIIRSSVLALKWQRVACRPFLRASNIPAKCCKWWNSASFENIENLRINPDDIWSLTRRRFSCQKMLLLALLPASECSSKRKGSICPIPNTDNVHLSYACRMPQDKLDIDMYICTLLSSSYQYWPRYQHRAYHEYSDKNGIRHTVTKSGVVSHQLK
jgi:hypothetical protein